MAKRNFLLGKGEQLTEEIRVKSGGAPKEPPYTFSEAKARLSPMLAKASLTLDRLPNDTFPDDQAVISLTLNPEYIAKSHYPMELLHRVGVEVVGSRPRRIKPEKRSRDRTPEPALTTELFAQGSRAAIRKWSNGLPGWKGTRIEEQLISIEEITAPLPKMKIKGAMDGDDTVTMEVVFHADELESKTAYLEAFQSFLRGREIPARLGRSFTAQGLSFLEVDVPGSRVEEVAEFSIVRVVRKMPDLRMLRPPVRTSGIPSKAPILPDEGPISDDIRVAIFDGGIPEQHALHAWVTSHEFEDTQPADPDFLEHGVAVTSAALFGHIDPNVELPRPYAHIDHFRVLDTAPGQDPYQLYEVLGRIDSVLSTEDYDFINLSLGPRLPIEDEEVHAWTAVLDDRLARSSTLGAIAVGNDGEGDDLLGLNRVQVPADCVNAIAVGACDSPGKKWQRAPYSSIGPGRSPGLVKPDLVDFGGALQRPFLVFSPSPEPSLDGIGGTSFAAPSVIRMATGIRAHFGENLNHLAIRALLVHTAERSAMAMREVGWGRLARNLDDIVLCDDDTARVVYQGEISPAKYMRARIPIPGGKLKGMVSITATLCYKSKTDPHHPGNYTRAGLEVTFRPDGDKFSRGATQEHPDSASFFGSKTFAATEEELRRDAWKWENCLHAHQQKRASSLNNPCFDIHYNSRLESRNHTPSEKLDYALVVTVKAKAVADLYDQVVRDYATLIEPIRPVLEVPIRT